MLKESTSPEFVQGYSFVGKYKCSVESSVTCLMYLAFHGHPNQSAHQTYLDPFSNFSTYAAHGSFNCSRQVVPVSISHIMHDAMIPHKSAHNTASELVQPFLYNLSTKFR